MNSNNKNEKRLGDETINYQSCLMKIIIYNNSSDIVVEFQDKYQATVHSTYQNFLLGKIKNPYFPSVFDVGIIGVKYPVWVDGKNTKEYNTWATMLQRCFDDKLKLKQPTYKDCNCCDEWLLYENFYEWLHSQENFDKWYIGNRWAIDKDILVKGNKVYSPETCCLVPQNVNCLFLKRDINRGDLPIGVNRVGNKFQSSCKNPFKNKKDWLGIHLTSIEAFQSYKIYKEDIIKQVAETEYKNDNITKKCYEAMLKYEVEIDD